MNRKSRVAVVALSVAILGATAASAMAETQWERNHPRREQVNNRLDRQYQRVNREYREGEISRGQARQLHREDRAIGREERTMAGFNHGHITRSEQRSLNQQENAVSRQIGR